MIMTTFLTQCSQVIYTAVLYKKMYKFLSSMLVCGFQEFLFDFDTLTCFFVFCFVYCVVLFVSALK